MDTGRCTARAALANCSTLFLFFCVSDPLPLSLLIFLFQTMNAPPQSLQACSTPEPQKAAVFNVAEYKRQMALKQSPPSATKDTAAPAKKEAVASKAADAKPAAKATAAPAAEAGVGVVDLANPGTPIMKVEVSERGGRWVRLSQVLTLS